MLHRVIREHLDDFLRAAADRTGGASLPGSAAAAQTEPVTLARHQVLKRSALAAHPRESMGQRWC